MNMPLSNITNTASVPIPNPNVPTRSVSLVQASIALFPEQIKALSDFVGKLNAKLAEGGDKDDFIAYLDKNPFTVCINNISPGTLAFKLNTIDNPKLMKEIVRAVHPELDVETMSPEQLQEKFAAIAKKVPEIVVLNTGTGFTNLKPVQLSNAGTKVSNAGTNNRLAISEIELTGVSFPPLPSPTATAAQRDAALLENHAIEVRISVSTRYKFLGKGNPQTVDEKKQAQEQLLQTMNVIDLQRKKRDEELQSAKPNYAEPLNGTTKQAVV